VNSWITSAKTTWSSTPCGPCQRRNQTAWKSTFWFVRRTGIGSNRRNKTWWRFRISKRYSLKKRWAAKKAATAKSKPAAAKKAAVKKAVTKKVAVKKSAPAPTQAATETAAQQQT
jgi:hypothetical protein